MSCFRALAFCTLNGLLVPNPVFIILYLAQVHSTWPCHIYASPSEKINRIKKNSEAEIYILYFFGYKTEFFPSKTIPKI